jgi:hypothetical protein
MLLSTIYYAARPTPRQGFKWLIIKVFFAIFGLIWTWPERAMAASNVAIAG